MWECRLDKDNSHLFAFLFDVPLGTGDVALRLRPRDQVKLWQLVGMATWVYRHDPRISPGITLRAEGYGDHSPQTTVDVTDIYGEKIQQAAEEMGIDWRPGQEIPGELMWYAHG